MVLDGIVNTSEMVTHVFPLSRVQEAFQLRNAQVDAHTGKGPSGSGADADTSSSTSAATAPGSQSAATAPSASGVHDAADAIHVLVDCLSTASEDVQVLSRLE